MLPKPGEEREGEPATSPPGFSSAAEGDASLAAGDFLRTMDESRFAVSAGAAGAPAVPKLALLALGDAVGPNAPHVPSPPPPSRTDWTRLVPPPVLTGHVSSLLPYVPSARPLPHQHVRRDVRFTLHYFAVRRFEGFRSGVPGRVQ